MKVSGEVKKILRSYDKIITRSKRLEFRVAVTKPPKCQTVGSSLIGLSVSQSSHSVVSDSATPWTAARQANLSITKSRSLLRLMFIEMVLPSNQLILCHPLLLLPSIFPSIRVFSSESGLRISWPKYSRFSFSISHSDEHPGLISSRIDWFDLLPCKGLSRVFSNTTVQKQQFFCAQLSL